MIRYRFALALIAALAATALGTRPAGAAAEVHRFNIVLSLIPTQIDGGGVNDEIDFVNRRELESRGLKGIERIKQGWMFEAQLRYMVNPRFAVNAGVGQLKKGSEQEYQPVIQQAIKLRWEVFSVPVSVGAAYYMAPYNQGDFQARAYLGGGFMSLVQNRLKFQQDSTVPGAPSFTSALKRDAPGFYGEVGVHMFFATRFSVMLGAIYRGAKVEALLDRATNYPVYGSLEQKPLSMDLSGVGGRMAVAWGF